MSSKEAILGTLFSDDSAGSSDENTKPTIIRRSMSRTQSDTRSQISSSSSRVLPRSALNPSSRSPLRSHNSNSEKKYYTSASSDTDRQSSKKNHNRRYVKTSADESTVFTKPPRRPMPQMNEDNEDCIVPNGFALYDLSRLASLNENTQVQYTKTNDTHIVGKYFKKYDSIGNTIVLGFYTSNKRNYTQSLSDIKYLFIKSVSGGENPLRGTIEVPKEEWKHIKRDTLISYRRNDNDKWVYRVKFLTFFTSKQGTTKMRVTNEGNYAYSCDPDKIAEIRRYVSDIDFKILSILKSIQMLDERLKKLEQKNK